MELKQFLKTVLGICLFPAAAAAVYTTGKNLADVFSHFGVTFPLLTGAAVYAAAHIIKRYRCGNGLKNDDRLYVLAHELSHAAAAVFSGVRVRSISVKKNSGCVVTDSSNLFITLAPYFIPFYTAAVLAAYFVCRLCFDIPDLREWALGAAGFTLAFHITHTADTLSGPTQIDLKKAGGVLFSIPLLTLMNCLFIAVTVKLLFPELLSIKHVSLSLLHDEKKVYTAVIYMLKYTYSILLGAVTSLNR